MSSTTSNLDDVSVPESKPRRSRIVKIAFRVGAVLLGLTALMGVLHMPFAAPLLRKILPGSFCPITHGTPEQIDRATAMGAAMIKKDGKEAAPSRPALGFVLDKTTKVDLDAWAKKNAVKCEAISGNETLQRCKDVPAAAVGQSQEYGPIEELDLEFRSAGTLVNVQTMRRRLTPELAARMAKEVENADVVALGMPKEQAGQPTAAHIGRSLMATYTAEHVFTDYRATVTATNLAPTGIMVREQYLSLN